MAYIITIDGPAGVGKSTLAKKLAAQLRVAYLDTGAMFRTLALHLSLIDPAFAEAPEKADEAKLLQALRHITFSLRTENTESILLCNDAQVGSEIRTEEAAMLAAKFAAIPLVRTFLKKEQQRLAGTCSFVAEGRDMGTEVFPKAQCKIFLDARPEVRANRRFKQLEAMGVQANVEELVRQITKRDDQDRNRKIAPLRPAIDAVIVDTSDLNLNTVFATILEIAKTHGCAAFSTVSKEQP